MLSGPGRRRSEPAKNKNLNWTFRILQRPAFWGPTATSDLAPSSTLLLPRGDFHPLSLFRDRGPVSETSFSVVSAVAAARLGSRGAGFARLEGRCSPRHARIVSE
jgi:hypothetical protein